jgi:hypothetical protein
MATAGQPDDANNNNPPPADGGGEPQTFTAEEVKALRDAAAKKDRELKEVRAQFTEFQKKFEGIDLDEYRKTQEEKARLERELVAKDPQKLEEHHEKKAQKLRTEYETRLKESTDRVAQLERQVKTLAVTDRVMTEVAGQFNEDVLDLVKGIVEQAADRDDDGQIFFKDENGDPLYNGARYLTAKEFAAQLIDRKPSLAKPVGSSGTQNATPVQKGRGVRKPTSHAEWAAMPEPQKTQAYNALTHDEKLALFKGVPVGRAM